METNNYFFQDLKKNPAVYLVSLNQLPMSTQAEIQSKYRLIIYLIPQIVIQIW